ncbi:IS200/IS605 family transposase [Deinococcus sp. QL22]|uniref:IS200/IS605 family transposase n=1 Tax=Deinococcus sp. QL22 TaxID=2939437 RepID=UPI00201763C4|nr:IS200/IS605 family transposase [Deinococcus sp. QL22]UQN10333.1 IS200/IS605 family transposase [Deinococcus sp. QL22]UQN10467.1 IS200/IS605 family transposase [Deinococcus sp. QL22]
MKQFRTSSHSAFRLFYHLVLITKYRRKCMNNAVLDDLEVITRNICEKWGCALVEFNGEADHVHILFEAHPHMEMSKFVGNLKTVTSRLIRKAHARYLSRWYWKPVFWSGSYAVVTAGGAPLEIIKRYIESQQRPLQ